ncbi:multiple sugar transport system ATP-binding protein [Arthrobacter sp. B2I5]|uniref:ABC transporter ATP-binding protein n=1 Tax=Arthrobacter sp. B2I5 TaxID=3042266 RepID=UPI002785E140|nr:ABC transporter ATP-binding protein [Arthrobacter sp. B2I5]MDQ0826232.1 multiple sugar transport system ATP-binding protein [Arthrobacter sp. B2I5]
MPTIEFDQVSKNFAGNTVIKDFDATVPDKEFLVLLGPSGCGKSTMLRMIAGLTDISSGELRFDGVVVNNLEPKKRNIAFVFQSYALYPHMSVRANIGFPLVMDNFRWWHHIPVAGGFARRALMKRKDIAAKIDQVAEMLELAPYLDRRPKALSGGQRQRVAVARSLIREPALYLLDEPLSNLDAKLRTQMRAEISALHDRVKKTFVYVTHDQVEAMTMGTRIIVLNDGVVQQYGTPKEIYDRPANTFVAKFIGAPPMNLIPVTQTGQGAEMFGNVLPFAPSGTAEGAMQLGIRAEKVTIHPDGQQGYQAQVITVEHLGAETVVGFKFGAEAHDFEVGARASRDLFYAKLVGDVWLKHGQMCSVSFDPDDVLWYSADNGELLDTAPMAAN